MALPARIRPPRVLLTALQTLSEGPRRPGPQRRVVPRRARPSLTLGARAALQPEPQGPSSPQRPFPPAAPHPRPRAPSRRQGPVPPQLSPRRPFPVPRSGRGPAARALALAPAAGRGRPCLLRVPLVVKVGAPDPGPLASPLQGRRFLLRFLGPWAEPWPGSLWARPQAGGCLPVACPLAAAASDPGALRWAALGVTKRRAGRSARERASQSGLSPGLPGVSLPRPSRARPGAQRLGTASPPLPRPAPLPGAAPWPPPDSFPGDLGLLPRGLGAPSPGTWGS